MPVAPSINDMITVGKAELQTRRPDLVVNDGDVSEAFLHVCAAMADAVIRLGAQLFKVTFFDGATGDDLTALVSDHLNIDRQAAEPAQVVVKFERTSSGAAETILAGYTYATQFDANGDTVEFTTDVDLLFGSGVNGPLTVNGTAVVAGTDGNVAASTLTRLVDSLVDSTFTVTNDAVAAGGIAEESDEALRERARAFYLTLRRATLLAIEIGAKGVASVAVATASENLSTGLVSVRVADVNGNSTLQMLSDVIAALESWRAAGINVSVVGGTRVVVDLAITLTDVKTGFDVAANSASIQLAVAARIDKLVPEQTMFLDSIEAQVIAHDPDKIYNVTIDTITLTPGGVQPIADVVPTPGQVFRAGSISVS